MSSRKQEVKDLFKRLDHLRGNSVAVTALGLALCAQNPKWLYDFMDQRNAERRLAMSWVPHHHGDVWDGARWCAAGVEQMKNARLDKIPVLIPNNVFMPGVYEAMAKLHTVTP